MKSKLAGLDFRSGSGGVGEYATVWFESESDERIAKHFITALACAAQCDFDLLHGEEYRDIEIATNESKPHFILD